MRHGPDMIVADFTQVDAFADRPFTGNPAAVIPLDGWLDDSILQAVAAENNLAETAFVVPATGSADYELRWFTPTVEVVLCGHEIGGASCRERVCQYVEISVVAVSLKTKQK